MFVFAACVFVAAARARFFRLLPAFLLQPSPAGMPAMPVQFMCVSGVRIWFCCAEGEINGMY